MLILLQSKFQVAADYDIDLDGCITANMFIKGLGFFFILLICYFLQVSRLELLYVIFLSHHFPLLLTLIHAVDLLVKDSSISYFSTSVSCNPI